MAKYSPDIAGIMSCLCDAVTDDAHGIEGSVIESSDSDNHDGEIYVNIPDGQHGTDKYLIKILQASSDERASSKKVATLTMEVAYDPQVTDAESIAGAAARLLETALSTPGILGEYGNPTFDTFRIAGDPR